MQNTPLRLALQRTSFGFDLIPSHEMMSAVEAMMESGKDEVLLKNKMADLQDDYDYILIDTPPGKSHVDLQCDCGIRSHPHSGFSGTDGN